MKQGAMKDIVTIVVRLTITCLVAGIIMGAAFLLTHDAKEHNEQVRDEKVMLSILGLVLSLHMDTPPGATVVLVIGAVFVFMLGLNRALNRYGGESSETRDR